MGRKKKQYRFKSRKPKRVVMTTEAFLSELDRLRDLAGDHDLTIRLGEIKAHSRFASYHVMFDDSVGVRVLNWWPATGKTWAPNSGAKGYAADCWIALDEAARLASISQLDAVAEQERHLDAIR